VDVDRLHSWHIPDSLRERKDIVIYDEHLFGEFLQERLGIGHFDPPDDLLQALGNLS
jgi:hypothetical protein